VDSVVPQKKSTCGAPLLRGRSCLLQQKQEAEQSKRNWNGSQRVRRSEKASHHLLP